MHVIYAKFYMMYVWSIVSALTFWGWIRNQRIYSLDNPRSPRQGLFQSWVAAQKWSSDFCKIKYVFFQLWIRASVYCNKWLKVEVPNVIWRKNDISIIFLFFHHFCYVGRHHLHGLFEVKFSFLCYLRRRFTVLEETMVLFPHIWPVVLGLTNC